MSLLHAIWIECDSCGQASTDLLGYETEELARDTAQRHGWQIVATQDGSTLDLCPGCIHVQEENIVYSLL